MASEMLSVVCFLQHYPAYIIFLLIYFTVIKDILQKRGKLKYDA